MDPAERAACAGIMQLLLSQRISVMFAEPIDPVADECPDYFSVIKTPMDLSTIQRRLADNAYASVNQWKSDVDLVWSNALLYNGPDSYVAVISRELEKLFQEAFRSYRDTPPTDWYGRLNSLIEEFGAEVKAISLTTPFVKRRSPSLSGIAGPLPDAADRPWTWDEIARLGEVIRSVTEKATIRRLMGILRGMEPEIVGDKKKLDVNLCELSPVTLAALQAEIGLPPRPTSEVNREATLGWENYQGSG
jgi:hypothetical protein